MTFRASVLSISTRYSYPIIYIYQKTLMPKFNTRFFNLWIYEFRQKHKLKGYFVIKNQLKKFSYTNTNKNQIKC